MLLLFFKILCDTTVESEISFFTFLIPNLDLFCHVFLIYLLSYSLSNVSGKIKKSMCLNSLKIYKDLLKS